MFINLFNYSSYGKLLKLIFLLKWKELFENLLMKKITCHISINKMPKASLKSKKSQSEPVKIGNNKPSNLIGIHTYLSSTTLFLSHFWIKRRQSPKLKIYWINETLKSSLKKNLSLNRLKLETTNPVIWLELTHLSSTIDRVQSITTITYLSIAEWTKRQTRNLSYGGSVSLWLVE